MVDTQIPFGSYFEFDNRSKHLELDPAKATEIRKQLGSNECEVVLYTYDQLEQARQQGREAAIQERGAADHALPKDPPPA